MILISAAAVDPRGKRLRLRFLFTPLLAIAAGFCGCAALHEEQLSIPHGTAIRHTEIPKELRLKLNLPENAKVELYGDATENASYRIEYEDGSISVIGPDGSSRGGII